METLPEIEPEAFDGWEDFIALRDSEFEAFQEFSGGKSPVEAIEQYDFTYRYKVSPDKKTFLRLLQKARKPHLAITGQIILNSLRN